MDLEAELESKVQESWQRFWYLGQRGFMDVLVKFKQTMALTCLEML